MQTLAIEQVLSPNPSSYTPSAAYTPSASTSSSAAKPLEPAIERCREKCLPKNPQEAAQHVFNLLKLEEEFGITEIQEKIDKVAAKHERKFCHERSQLTSISHFFGFSWNPSNTDLTLNRIAGEQQEHSRYYQTKLKDLETEMTTLAELEQSRTQKRSAIDCLLDKTYKVRDDNISKIREKNLRMTEQMFTLHLGYLSQQKETIARYTEVLVEYKKHLFTHHSKAFRHYDGQMNLLEKVEDLLQKMEISTGKIDERIKIVENNYEEFKVKYKQKSSNYWVKYSDLKTIYLKYYQDPIPTFQLVIQALHEISAYALQNPPTEQKRQIMNNLFLVHELLNGDDPSIKLLRFQMEKSLVIDSFFRGFSSSEEELEDDPDMPEKFKRIADILELLPQVIALFEGMKSGSFLPLISVSLFAETAGLPGAWVFPILNVALGAYENMTHVHYIQEASRILSQEQRTKFVYLLKTLEKKYADMDELQKERNLMAGLRELICIEGGHPTTHIFQRIARHYKDFKLKMECAGKPERTVRLLVQIGIPSLIFTSVIIGIIAAAIGIAPVGIIILAEIIGAMWAIAGGAYTAYQVGTALNRLVDEFYAATAEEATRQREDGEAKEKLSTFLKLNQSKIEELIQQSWEHLETQVERGDFNEFFKSKGYDEKYKDYLDTLPNEKRCDPALRKEEFLRREKEEIRSRLQVATYLKAHHQLTPLDADAAILRIRNLEKNFALFEILNPSEEIRLKEELMQEAKKQGLELTEGGYAALQELGTNQVYKQMRKEMSSKEEKGKERMHQSNE